MAAKKCGGYAAVIYGATLPYLYVSRAAAPAAPTSPTSPGSGRFKMAAKLVSQLTPKSSPTRAGGRISKNKFSNSSAK